MRALMVFTFASALAFNALSQGFYHDVGNSSGRVEEKRAQQLDFANRPADFLYQVRSSSNSGWTNTWRTGWAGCINQSFFNKYKPTEWIVQIESTVEPGEQSVCTAAVNMIPKTSANAPTKYYSAVQVRSEKFTLIEKSRRKYAFEEACVKEAFQNMVDEETGRPPRESVQDPCDPRRL